MAKKALEGVRVLDHSIVWAGPYAGRILGELGAEVIVVEHPKGYGFWYGMKVLGSQVGTQARRLGWKLETMWGGMFVGGRDVWSQQCGGQKRFIALDTTNPEGWKVYERLVKASDVVMENLETKTTEKLGLTYERLKVINPNIIVCRIPAIGLEGPWSKYASYGGNLEAGCGLTGMTGYKGDETPQHSNLNQVDPIGAMYAAAAIIAALRHRKKTGDGQEVVVSQWEGAIDFMAEGWMEAAMNNRNPKFIGNDDRAVPFQGCYPTKGGGPEDWVVLSIRSNDEWECFCHIIGKEEWLKDDKFRDASRLEANRKEVDNAITTWMQVRDKKEIVYCLQNRHIAAGWVATPWDVIFDPQLKYNGFINWIDHFWGQCIAIPRMPAMLTKTPSEVSIPHKRVGHDNDYVYGEILGMSQSEIAELKERGVIYSDEIRKAEAQLEEAGMLRFPD